MSKREELKLAVLEPDQTIRVRALELAILSERELRYITLGNTGEKVDTWDQVTTRMLERADAFWAYISDATMPSADNLETPVKAVEE